MEVCTGEEKKKRRKEEERKWVGSGGVQVECSGGRRKGVVVLRAGEGGEDGEEKEEKK